MLAFLSSVVDFRRARVDSSAMTYSQLREYVRRLGASGFNVAEQAVDLRGAGWRAVNGWSQTFSGADVTREEFAARPLSVFRKRKYWSNSA